MIDQETKNIICKYARTHKWYRDWWLDYKKPDFNRISYLYQVIKCLLEDYRKEVDSLSTLEYDYLVVSEFTDILKRSISQ